MSSCQITTLSLSKVKKHSSNLYIIKSSLIYKNGEHNYRGAFGARCITLEPSEVTPGVYIKEVRFWGLAYVDGHMIVPAYKRIFIITTCFRERNGFHQNKMNFKQ